MELSKALSNIKSVCDDSLKQGRFNNLEDAQVIIESYNMIVSACNYAASKRKEEEQAKLPPLTNEQLNKELSETD